MPRKYIKVDSDFKGEVIIYSSSHFSETRGLRRLLLSYLSKDIKVTVHARGGRTWDEELIRQFNYTQRAEENGNKLHIILLGDNDVRHDVRKGFKPNRKVEALDKFKNYLSKLGHRSDKKKDTVIVCGLIPHPVDVGPGPFEDTIKNYSAGMLNLTTAHEKVFYAPMRKVFIDYCFRGKNTLADLFRPDKVHLNSVGERCVAQYLGKQIYHYVSRVMGQSMLTNKGLSTINPGYFGHLIRMTSNSREKKLEFLGETILKSSPTVYYACSKRMRMVHKIADQTMAKQRRKEFRERREVLSKKAPYVDECIIEFVAPVTDKSKNI